MMHLHLPWPGARRIGWRPPGRERSTRWKGPLAGILAGGLAAIALGCQTQAPGGPGQTDLSETAPHPREKTYLKRQWGVEIMYVRQTAAGYMLEFRYRVLDPEKAKPLFERRIKPVLTHAESGAKLIVPTPAKTGALRNSNSPIAGRTYWMFFANPGKLVQPGQHVSVVIGEFHADGLVVQ
jgi:hypothetical protein